MYHSEETNITRRGRHWALKLSLELLALLWFCVSITGYQRIGPVSPDFLVFGWPDLWLLSTLFAGMTLGALVSRD